LSEGVDFAAIPHPSNPRGAEWHRWDLHVHTPASVEQHYGDSQQESTWTEFIAALAALPPEIKALGINDYFSLEGYRRVLDAKRRGQLPNLDLILPVVELRIAAFAGSAELQKLNFHAVFSDQLTADDIERFFLRKLDMELTLDEKMEWKGDVGTREGIIALGEAVIAATPPAKRTQESALRVGFRSAAVDLDKVRNALDQSVFRGFALTAIGLGEWGQMRWDGAGAAQKRDAITRADLVLTCAGSPEKYRERLSHLREQCVNSRLIDCSDSHFYASSTEPNRLGNSYTWLKSDLSFRGLRRALQRFDERVYVGATPPKLELVNAHRTKYIDRIEIRKKTGSNLSEAWFDVDLPLNPDLVAVIGNQGSGKSALTDTVGLCGNAKCGHFSFLTSDKFCDRQQKASQFEARLHWADGKVTERTLSDAVDRSEVERVRYVPQGFFDILTNEKTVREEGHFYGEIKKTIFSHVSNDDRLGRNSLDELLKLHTSELEDSLASVRKEVSDLNRRIIDAELSCTDDKILAAEKAVAQKKADLEALRANPPGAVAEPPGESETRGKIDGLRKTESQLQEQMAAVEGKRAIAKRQLMAGTKAIQAIDTAAKQVTTTVERIGRELKAEGVTLALDKILSLSVDITALDALLAERQTVITTAGELLDTARAGSLAAQATLVHNQRELLEKGLAEAGQRYQTYLTAVETWKARISELQGFGKGGIPDSLMELEAHVHQLKNERPKQLLALQLQRRAKCKEIHEKVLSLAAIFETLTAPVRAHINNEQLTREKYKLDFSVGVRESGLADSLFNLVGQSLGTFSGVQPGRDLLAQMIGERDFSSSADAVDFAEALLRDLEWNQKHGPPVRIDLGSGLKKGATLQQLYDLIFGLEYLSPQFAMALNGKPLRQLSPGERGILLLVFYLVVDIGEEPLIIDQPEGNLNNQSIFEHLVPVFLAAKRRRQIIIVTHNPNLAVVCDADQIVHCEHREDTHELVYEGGALENPRFNRFSLDLLEGTAKAFEARGITYDS